VLSHTFNVYNLYKTHNLWWKTRRRPPPPPNSYCIVNLLVLKTTWWWPTYKSGTFSCVLHSDTMWQIVFLTACICENTHNYIHCITDLTQWGWHPLRITVHIPYYYFAPPNLLGLQYKRIVSEMAESSDIVLVYERAE
jgi:hypothetical protein